MEIADQVKRRAEEECKRWEHIAADEVFDELVGLREVVTRIEALKLRLSLYRLQ
jgi:hypothetical protein